MMAVKVDFTAFSNTALDRYNKCSEYFRLYYLEKGIPRPPDTFEQRTGQVCHSVVEQYYLLPESQRPTPIDPFLETFWKELLAANRMSGLYAYLHEIASDLANLKLRASADYSGPGAIRNKTGEASRRYVQTTAWKTAVANLRLDERQAKVDRMAAMRNGGWGEVSFSAVFAESWAVLTGWIGPSEIGKILNVELVISRQQRLFYPGTPDAFFLGKIDLVCYLHDGRLAIIDWKTSKEAPESYEVAHLGQLLGYGWAYSVLRGVMPAVIGIGSLRHKRLILAEYNHELALKALTRRVSAIGGIQSGVFIKQSPTDYHQVCWNSFMKDNCFYLPVCHPEFAAIVMKNRG